MEPICHLDSLWRTSPGSVSIGSGSIAADHLDAGMDPEPDHKGLCLAIWQYIGYAVGLEIHQDRAIAVAFFPGKIIYP